MLHALSCLGSLYTCRPPEMVFPCLLTWINVTHLLVGSMSVMSLGKLYLTPKVGLILFIHAFGGLFTFSLQYLFQL